MFSSRYMLFPTLKKMWCKKKFPGGGGVENFFLFLEKQFFLISRFDAIFNIKKIIIILKNAPSLTG